MTERAAPGQGIPLRWDAVVLAGGRASRLGGVAKPLVEVRGRPMLDAAVAAAAGAQRVVVVGQVPVPPGVRQTVEDPPHSGPAAGLAAGLAALEADTPWVLVLASDLPGAEEAVPALLEAAADDPSADGVCFYDDAGHPQWMLAIYRGGPLRRAVAQVETTNLSLRRLLAPLSLRSIPGEPSALRDCDTWDDVAAANAVTASPTTPPESEDR